MKALVVCLFLVTSLPCLCLAETTNYSQFFLPTYESSREAFIKTGEELKKTFVAVESSAIKVPSRVDNSLFIDTLYVPAQKKPKALIVLISGTHGVEGFVGSALQRMIIDRLLLQKEASPALDFSETGYLLIHALNPYGFKMQRRVSENNIDLNRNFGVDDRLFLVKNEGYARLNAMLNPKDPVENSWLSRVFFYARWLGKLATGSFGALRQSILKGQYEFPEGIFYGGRAFEFQRQALSRLLLQVSREYRNIMMLDLHTGYGKRGVMHLIPAPFASQRMKDRAHLIFGDYPIEDTGETSKDFYYNTGDLSHFVEHLIEEHGKNAISMALEYGTLDSQTYTGALKSLRRVVQENQNFWHHGKDRDSESLARSEFFEMFNPPETVWREKTMEQTAHHLPIFFERFRKYLP